MAQEGDDGAAASAESGSSSSSSESAEAAAGSEEVPKKEEPLSPKVKQSNASSSSSSSSDDWGSFYDPNNIFCGKYDCYKILGFDYETWGSAPPTLKEITKSYRGLSRQWHPDKNKAKGAREKFVAIAKAYEILTNSDKRKEFDYYRDRPDEYFQKYGSSVLWTYAPKSDATIISIVLFILANVFTYYAQRNKYDKVANHLIRAAVEDWSAREGGSTESIEIREKALAILAEKREKENEAAAQSNGESPKKKEKGPRLTAKEKREREQDELRPICASLVNEIDDFGAGFRKPTYKDLLVIKMVKWPYYVGSATLWWSKYAMRRMRKLELNDEEREVLTKNAVGNVAWEASPDEERATMITLELWVSDNLVEWREEQDMKREGLSANKRKQIKKMRKRGSGGDYYDEDLHLE
jgi:DnaJ family protein C protein 25